jgi:PAS domain S-box-containing protein
MTGSAADVTARHRAEAALRESEAKYRALFDEMDEAYAVVEVISDGAGGWGDFRFLEVNRAFVEHTGMVDPVGRTATELLGTPNPRWAEVYGRVAETGEPMRLEETAPALDRTFDLNVFRLGGEGSRRVAALFTDVTERKRLERRQAYLLKLIDALRPLAGPADIKRTAAQLLGEHLGVNRVLYADAQGTDWVVARAYEQGVEPQADGHHPMAPFGAWIIETLRTGQRLVIRDVRCDARFEPSQRAAHEALHIIGAAAVPLVKAGTLVAILVAHTAAPREWSDQDLALIEETAERT